MRDTRPTPRTPEKTWASARSAEEWCTNWWPTQASREGTKTRVVILKGEPWLVAADVCRALGIKNVSDALKRLGADEQTLVRNETHA